MCADPNHKLFKIFVNIIPKKFERIPDLRFQNAIISELSDSFKQIIQNGFKPFVTSVYFGGGTPSLANGNSDYALNLEISIEANPTSIETSKLEEFFNAGINRLSLGVQLFGRNHTFKDLVNASKYISSVRSTWHSDIHLTIDLIWGRPGQNIVNWKQELEESINMFNPDHMSLYQLTFERGTPLYNQFSNSLDSNYTSTKKFSEIPNSDEAAEFYDCTINTAKDLGYLQYEVSSFEKFTETRDNRSKHNLSYWKGSDYIGVGPGAHGRVYRTKLDESNGLERIQTFR
ncbi:radical S-adenosyl methionine domain-containing protein 1, partial [Nowakowskiella sp. JEL0078]